MEKGNIAKARLRILALALSLALVFAAAGTAYGAVSKKTSQAVKTETSETTKASEKTSTTAKDEANAKTETAEKIEQTGGGAGSGKAEPEPEPEPEPEKIDISNFTVSLESYFESVTGKEIMPVITSVSGRVTVKLPTETKTDDTKTTTVSKDISFEPEECEVKYYRIHSYSEEKYEEVTKITSAGDYRIVVTPKDTEAYEGEAVCLFSVMGKPQKLTIAKAKYSLTFGDDAPLLSPKADGDGTGFTFYTSDSSILKVSADGQTKILRPGRAIVTIYTAGTTLSQQAKIQVIFEIGPQKTLWNTAKMKKQASAGKLTWQKQTGVTKYEILYGTSKSFAKSKTKTKTVKGSLTRATLKNLKKGKTYYVKIRALTETTDTREYKRTMTGAWSAVYKISVPKA